MSPRVFWLVGLFLVLLVVEYAYALTGTEPSRLVKGVGLTAFVGLVLFAVLELFTSFGGAMS